MRKLSLNKLLLSCFISGISLFNMTAQEGQVNITENSKITKLLELKSEMSRDNEIGDRYKIQLFYGNNGEANEVIK